jgi:8-oxo-dGTP pyrophosphatase MutT (NUDIX family)
MRKIIYLCLSSAFLVSSMNGMHPPSLGSFDHHAAFVGPITKYGNQDYIILGREAHGTDKGLYDAFGGKRDASDSDQPDQTAATAAREFFEEGITARTLGMSLADVRTYISLGSRKTKNIFAVTRRRGGPRNVLYLTEFSNADILRFKNSFGRAFRRAPRGRGFREKDALASVRLSDIKHAIAASPLNTGVQVAAQVTDLNGKRSMKLITLRPVLVSLLRGFAENRTFVQGACPQIRFYTL